jgi:hypothetical protein
MANSLIQIKQSFLNAAPISLNVGEPAYSYVSNTLFIGTPDNAGYVKIGGFSEVLRLDEAYHSANSGFIQANAGFLHANAAFIKANSGYESQNSSGEYANAAFIRANNSLNANLGGQVTGVTTFNSNTRASSNTTGDLVVVGGAAVKGNVYTGSIYITGNGLSGTLNAIVFGDGTTQNTSPAAIALSANLAFGNANGAFAKSNAAFNAANAAFIRANNAVNANLGGTITATTAATSNISGALIVSGGVGIKGNVYTGSIVMTGNGVGGLSNTITFPDGTVQNTSPVATSYYANSAFANANAAFAAANAAFANANGAFAKSNAAYAYANGAYTAANLAFNQANSGFIQANSAYAQANAAYLSQNATGQYANAAYTRANNSLSANVGGTVTGDVTITGNLSVIGNTTYVNTSQVLIADNIITLNAAIDQTSAPILNAGIEIDRGIDANVFLLWNESLDKWTVTNDGTNYYVIGSDAAESYANSAFIKANSAYNSQNATGQYANSAFFQANSAYTQANAAYTSQNATGQYANSAFIQANSAYNSQNATGQYANAAFIRANNSLNANVGGNVTGEVVIIGNLTSNTLTTTGSNGSISGANAIFTNYIFAANGTVDLYIYSSNAYANANAGFAKANAAFANANGAFAGANAAYIQANSGFIQANAAFGHANAAYQSQNATGQYANSAFIHANSAYQSQNATGQYANSAFIQANSAYESQNATGQYANAAFTVANGAFFHANAAYQSQNATGQYANSAFTHANASFNHANSGFIQSNSAFIHANSAYATANFKTETFVQDTAPASANVDDIWIDSSSGIQYVYINSNSANQWVEFSAYSSPLNGTANIQFADQTIFTVNSAQDLVISNPSTANIKLISGNTVVTGNLIADATGKTASFNNLTAVYFRVNTATTIANTAAVNIVGSTGYYTQVPTSNGYMMQITGNDNSTSRVVNDSAGVGSYSAFIGRHARGTHQNPTAAQANDLLARFSGNGYGATGYGINAGGASMDVYATQNYTDTSRGSKLVFSTTANNTNVRTISATIDANTATFSGTVVPEKGFVYPVRKANVANSVAVTIDFANDAIVRCTVNANMTVYFTNYETGKIVDLWITNLSGLTRTITHGLSATNSTVNSTTQDIPSTSTAKFQYYSIDGNAANTFVAIIQG